MRFLFAAKEKFDDRTAALKERSINILRLLCLREIHNFRANKGSNLVRFVCEDVEFSSQILMRIASVYQPVDYRNT